MPSIYATYLCTEPSNQYLSPADDRLEILQRSSEYFSKRSHMRAVERLQFEIAKLYMQNEQWESATHTLVPLWQTLSWRKAGWWYLLEQVDQALKHCARLVGDGESLIAVEWELLNTSLPTRSERHTDFSKCLEGVEISQSHPKVVIQADNTLSCISATFAFDATQGYVGEALPAQLVISSRAHKSSAPIKISNIKIAFEGGLKNVNIQHDPKQEPQAVTADGSVHLYNVDLHSISIASDSSAAMSTNSSQAASFLLGSSDLSFTPGNIKALCLFTLPRDDGPVEALGITFCVEESSFELDVVVSDDELHQQDLWVATKRNLVKKRLGTERNSVVTILPKPPKLRIELPSFKDAYLTDECVNVDIQVIHEEEEVVDVNLDVRFLRLSETIPSLEWALEGKVHRSTREIISDGEAEHRGLDLSTTSLGQLNASERRKRSITIQAPQEPAEYTLEITARYHLLSDPETSIFKTLSTSMIFVHPFDVKYDLLPRPQISSWPNYFEVEDLDNTSSENSNAETSADGLSQSWSLAAGIVSLSVEPLIIEGVDVRVLSIRDQAICEIFPVPDEIAQVAVLVSTNELQQRRFHIEVKKKDLEDRRSVIIHLQLQVRWRGESSDATTTTTNIAAPDLVMSFGEPRVLASTQRGQGAEDLVHLDYTIENPSMHVLTFNLTMESSEDFAFSGAKTTSLQLVPLSRHTIRYNLLPLVKGVWISPQLKVLDINFRKVLKVNVTDGMRSDKRGILIWIDA